MIRVGLAASEEDAQWLGHAMASAAELVTVPELAAAAVILASTSRSAEACDAAGDRPVLAVGELAHADPRAAFVVRAGLSAAALRQLVLALAGQAAPVAAPPAVRTTEEARQAQRAFVASRRLASATTLAEAEALAIEGLLELMDAERGQCLFCDSDWSLWSQTRLDAGGDGRRAVAGLAGFAARTSRQVVAHVASEDPRWVAAIDDPPGAGRERVVAQPVIAASGEVHGVLVACRGERRAAYSALELVTLERFAGLLSPFFDQLAEHAGEQALLTSEASEGLFRTEALVAQEAPRYGELIRLAPPWVGWVYGMMMAMLIGAAAYLTLATVSTYSTGPALLRASSKRELVTRTSGNITQLAVEPGDPVAAGAIIARLDDAPQRAALERAERELAAELRNHMLDPSDASAEAAVRARRQERDAARAQLEERLVRSPGRGMITEVRARPGQRVEPGDLVAAMVDGEGAIEVIALLPGADRPQLAPGMTLRIELTGYHHLYQSLLIEEVSADVMGPAEARRVLGPQVKESVNLGGPVVLVRGRLPRPDITFDGETYRLHDGMVGNAAVRVRSERVLFALIPGLRGL